MGQDQSSVQVANAFPHKLYIRVDVQPISIKRKSKKIEAHLLREVIERDKIMGLGSHRKTASHDIGFRLVPYGEVTTFHPAIQEGSESKSGRVLFSKRFS